MSLNNEDGLDQIKVDVAGLCREEIFSDGKAATFRKLIPVTAAGEDDPARKSTFVGQTTIMSPMGTLPITAPLQAKTLEEAITEFPAAIKKAVEQLIAEAREYQRQEASRIVVPDAKTAGGIHLA